LLFFSALAFLWLQLRGLYPPELPGINIDAEWIYRKALPRIALWITGPLPHPRPRGRAGADPAIGLHGAVDDCPLVGVSVAVVPLTVYRRNKLPVLRSARAEMITARQRAGRER
jgi:hypothetical protein